jgi:uncharacterized metal-binding protein
MKNGKISRWKHLEYLWLSRKNRLKLRVMTIISIWKLKNTKPLIYLGIVLDLLDRDNKLRKAWIIGVKFKLKVIPFSVCTH